jgi:hypothetical protein
VYVCLKDEITELIGETMYARLAADLDERRNRVHLPHPAVRR